MADSAQPVPVRETGDRMVFEVISRGRLKRGKTEYYRVDLLAHGGAGACHCKDWQTRRWSNIRDGKPAGSHATLCWHGIMARRYFINHLLAAMAAKDNH